MTIKLKGFANHLLRDIAAGQTRVFAQHDQPFGWSQLTSLGFAERIEGTDRARITDAGLEWLKNNPI